MNIFGVWGICVLSCVANGILVLGVVNHVGGLRESADDEYIGGRRESWTEADRTFWTAAKPEICSIIVATE